MRRANILLTGFVVGLLGFVGVSPLVADTIELTNPSFEGTNGWPKIADGFDDPSHDVAGWSNGGWSYADTGIDWVLGGVGPHNGGWAAYFRSGDGSAKQDTSHIVAAGDTFVLTFWSACTQSGYLQAELYYETGSGRHSFASITASSPTWSQFTLNAQAPTEAVGSVVGIELFGRATSGTAWPLADDVSLSYSAVPEPSGIVIVVSALLGLLAYAWRRKR